MFADRACKSRMILYNSEVTLMNNFGASHFLLDIMRLLQFYPPFCLASLPSLASVVCNLVDERRDRMRLTGNQESLLFLNFFDDSLNLTLTVAFSLSLHSFFGALASLSGPCSLF